MLGSRARPSSRRGIHGVHVATEAPLPRTVAFKPAVMAADELSATELLLRTGSGDTGAVERMFPLVHDELKRLAHRHLARESSSRTLGTTELVPEAYLRLGDQTRVEWGGRAHFMGVDAIAMRRILVDRARSRRRLKRGGGSAPIALDIVDLSADDRADLVLALDEALD